MEGRGEVRRGEEGNVEETTQVDAVERRVCVLGRWGGGCEGFGQ